MQTKVKWFLQTQIEETAGLLHALAPGIAAANLDRPLASVTVEMEFRPDELPDMTVKANYTGGVS